MNLHDLLNKLEAQENDFLDAQVLAPVLPGRAVTVRIAGVVCRLKVDDESFQGWGVLQPIAMDGALILRPANRTEISRYLQLLPSVHLLAVARAGTTWQALPTHQGNQRIKLDGPVRLELAEESVQPFDAVIARFDGGRFWYERPDARRNPALAAYLRQSFSEGLQSDMLHKKGLSREEREAYVWACEAVEEARRNREERLRNREQRLRREEAMRRNPEEVRLADALAHAEGSLVSFIERDDVYTVRYQINDRTHTSTIRKDDLTVVTSGICLSGQDDNFDLTSIVGVMREAAAIGMPDEAEYY